RLIPSITFLLLFGLPSLAWVGALVPATAELEIMRRTLPAVYETLVSALRLAIAAFLGVLLLTLLLMIFPVRGNPIAIIILAPLAIIVTLAVGTGLARINVERLFGWPLVVGSAAIVLMLLFF